MEVFIRYIKLKVGRGERVRFWKDSWIGDRPLADRFPQLYRVANSRCKNISEVRSREYSNRVGAFSGDLNFKRNLNEKGSQQVTELILLMDSNNVCLEVAYRRIWTEMFTCRSLFKDFITPTGSQRILF